MDIEAKTKHHLKALFGNEPYDYQVRVAQALLVGQNVILRAPTGAGKTEAALGPYLIARKEGREDFPLRCIFASPMRTLAKDLYVRAKEVGDKLGLTVKLHTGEDPSDPQLEADIIVTTVDQLLSNYLHVPYSQSQSGRNIGAGGVIASYVVLDEFHLFDSKRAFRTTIEMARNLQGITPFLFMTATFSEDLTKKLADAVGAEFITPQGELETMTSQQKTRTICRAEGLLTAEDVAHAHQRRSIAIANTVKRVQTLYADLKRLKNEGDPRLQGVELVMLHSKYFPSHRNKHEQLLRTLLGREAEKHINVILVASQAIEVGLDISCEQLHTEICPANALLQRAGRNARYIGEDGVVSVYALPINEKTGLWDILPYKGQEEVIRQTWEALAALPSPITPKAENNLVDAVHTGGDLLNWKSYQACRETTHLDNTVKAMNGDRGMRSELIRDIQNISLLMIGKDADLSSWDEVNRHERLSATWVDFATLEQNREKLDLNFDHELNWLAKVPCEVESEKKASSENTYQPPQLEWISVTSAAQLRNEMLVLINPKFVFYNQQEGFRWEPSEGGELGVAESNIPKAHPKRNSGDRPDYWYTYETYEEHITRVLSASIKHAADVWHLCSKVDKKFGLPAGTMELALKVAIASHDIGKLSSGWQKWTRNWQAEQLKEYMGRFLWDGAEGQFTAISQAKGQYCAHTDYHPKYDKERNKRSGSRPPHAGESAAVFIAAFKDELQEKVKDDQKVLKVMRGIAGAII